MIDDDDAVSCRVVVVVAVATDTVDADVATNTKHRPTPSRPPSQPYPQ